LVDKLEVFTLSGIRHPLFILPAFLQTGTLGMESRKYMENEILKKDLPCETTGPYKDYKNNQQTSSFVTIR